MRPFSAVASYRSRVWTSCADFTSAVHFCTATISYQCFLSLAQSAQPLQEGAVFKRIVKFELKTWRLGCLNLHLNERYSRQSAGPDEGRSDCRSLAPFPSGARNREQNQVIAFFFARRSGVTLVLRETHAHQPDRLTVTLCWPGFLWATPSTSPDGIIILSFPLPVLFP